MGLSRNACMWELMFNTSMDSMDSLHPSGHSLSARFRSTQVKSGCLAGVQGLTWHRRMKLLELPQTTQCTAQVC
eukprot:750448-Hanusia_phi.AAC.10